MLIVQAGAAMVAPLALVFAPPEDGAMLLVPVGQTNALQFAREHSAMLVRSGPIAGSIVVRGRRDRLAYDPFKVVALAADPMGCGTFETES